MSKKYKIFHEGNFVKEEDYEYLISCSEENATLFNEKVAESVMEFLGGDAKKIKEEENK
jgi:hypothetical protein